MLLTLPDLAATERFAARVAAAMRPGDTILLAGALGAGKTAFARALLRAATGDPALDVPSPSFTLVQSYDTPRGTVHHFDLWRLDGPAALTELGWDDARDDIVLVEWPDRLGADAPPDALRLDFELTQGDARIARVEGWSGRLANPSVVVGPVVARHPPREFGMRIGAADRVDPGGVGGVRGELGDQPVW
jgi:tRNA threonylcarbamoyladenosine biosynthesis protein TsaE